MWTNTYGANSNRSNDCLLTTSKYPDDRIDVHVRVIFILFFSLVCCTKNYKYKITSRWTRTFNRVSLQPTEQMQTQFKYYECTGRLHYFNVRANLEFERQGLARVPYIILECECFAAANIYRSLHRNNMMHPNWHISASGRKWRTIDNAGWIRAGSANCASAKKKKRILQS